MSFQTRQKKLILHYFNDSKADNSYERALEAISRYYADDLPPEEEWPARLQSMMKVLRREADAWDAD